MNFSVSDRERMLGLPVGYVQRPVEKLFSSLTKCFITENWTEDPECVKFSKDFSGCNFKFSEQKVNID
jgi:hypothetical protein